MLLSRVAFLKACALGLLGSCVDTAALASAAIRDPLDRPQRGGSFRLEDARVRTFQPHLNSAFLIRADAGRSARRVVLAEVAERPTTGNVERFSLMFHAPIGEAIPQGSYPFHHPALASFNLFIVPINRPNARRVVYQACFSRHVTPSMVSA